MEKINTACFEEIKCLYKKFIDSPPSDINTKDDAMLALEDFIRNYRISPMVGKQLQEIKESLHFSAEIAELFYQGWQEILNI